MNEPHDYSLADEAPSPSSAANYALEIPSDCAGLRVDQALARLFPEHSRSRLQGWLKDGRVLINGAVREAKHKVWGGEQLHLDVPPLAEETAFAPENIPLDVVFEDEHILVLNKPAGLVVHPGSGNWQGTLLNALLHHAPHLAGLPRAGIVHRLDKDTTGLMVVAKTLEAQTDLVRQLQARTVKRHYWAVVEGRCPASGVVDAPIGRHPTQRTRMAVLSSGKPAVTHYRVQQRFARHAWVECQLETGRTHQIRVHMAHIGHPLAGDPVYGGRRPLVLPLLPDGTRFARQALHAFRLGLVHPQLHTEMSWQVPVPADFAALIAALQHESSLEPAP